MISEEARKSVGTSGGKPMPNKELLTVGDRIKWLRECKDMSQGALSRAIGVKQPSLSALEAGESKRPNAANLLKIAAVLNANPEWIVSGRGDPWQLRPIHKSGATEMLEAFNAMDDMQRAMILAAARAIMLDK